MSAKILTPLFLSTLYVTIPMTWARAEGAAKIGCEAEENGRRAPASFRALRGETEIASGICGRDVGVPEGPVTLLVTLDGVLAEGAQRFELEARTDRPARASARFETGELLVEVTRDGRRGSGMVHLTRADGATARTSAGVESRVGVGTYTVEVESRGEHRRIDGVTIARGAREVRKVAFGGTLK